MDLNGMVKWIPLLIPHPTSTNPTGRHGNLHQVQQQRSHVCANNRGPPTFPVIRVPVDKVDNLQAVQEGQPDPGEGGQDDDPNLFRFVPDPREHPHLRPVLQAAVQLPGHAR